MRNLYKQLYNDCSNIENFKSISHFVSIHGKHFTENERRFLLIGRSTNGWFSIDAGTADDFGAEAQKQFHDTTRWNWVESVDGTLYSTHDKDKEHLKNRYCIDKKPYWTCSHAIYEQLHGSVHDDEIWMENIAWTNLYKISPKEYNPDYKLMKSQKDTCIEILKKELEYYNPTHILVMTGYDWFEPFSSVFTNVFDSRRRNICRGKQKNEIYVEGKAKFRNAPVVIACRPEWRDKEKYVASVLSAFK